MRHYHEVVTSLISNNNFRTVVEVGTWTGELSRKIWSQCNLDKFYMVDPMLAEFNKMDGGYTCEMDNPNLAHSQDALDNAVMQLRSELPSNVEFLRMTSKEASAVVPNELDLVFIDAVHLYEYCSEDIKMWLPKIRSGGILCGHDYDWVGVKRAVDELLPNKEIESYVWIYRKS